MHHFHSPIATAIEAAKLVRNCMENFVPELEKSGHNFDSETLLGACGIASYCLQRVLRAVQVRSKFVMGVFDLGDQIDRGQHCWVELQEFPIILDVTATQFDITSPVHITSIDDPKYVVRWKNDPAFRQLQEWRDQSHLFHMNQLRSIIKSCVSELHDARFVAM